MSQCFDGFDVHVACKPDWVWVIEIDCKFFVFLSFQPLMKNCNVFHELSFQLMIDLNLFNFFFFFLVKTVPTLLLLVIMIVIFKK